MSEYRYKRSKKTKSKRGGRRSRCRSIKKSKYNQLKHQIGGAGEVYQLIDVNDDGNIIEVYGETTLTFNTDRTSKTFHETYLYMLRSVDGSATQCYHVPTNDTWYQLTNMEGIIYQVSFDGSRIRSVQRKPTAPKLNDDQIIELLRVDVKSGVGTDPAWEGRLLQALETGAASVMDFKRILKRQTSDGDDNIYLGGRWLTPRLQRFLEKYPEYKSILL
jgi:hypothetical protein